MRELADDLADDLVEGRRALAGIGALLPDLARLVGILGRLDHCNPVRAGLARRRPAGGGTVIDQRGDRLVLALHLGELVDPREILWAGAAECPSFGALLQLTGRPSRPHTLRYPTAGRLALDGLAFVVLGVRLVLVLRHDEVRVARGEREARASHVHDELDRARGDIVVEPYFVCAAFIVVIHRVVVGEHLVQLTGPAVGDDTEAVDAGLEGLAPLLGARLRVPLLAGDHVELPQEWVQAGATRLVEED